LGHTDAMPLLDSWAGAEHESPDGMVRPLYRKGSGPGVIVIHELPGITPEVIAFAEEVVDAGFTVVLPHLFGRPEGPSSFGTTFTSLVQVCTAAEFTKLATGVTTPMAGWLRSLARSLHDELGGPGVGALGMCFTGGFALAMMVDDSVAAPVVAQPAAPFPFGRTRAADINLSPADTDAMVARASAGCQVLGVRYRQDRASGGRFQTLRGLLGDNFVTVELEGKGHSTLTEQRSQEAVDRVLAFFREKLTSA
jgi:dienelactone hydrolase